MFQSIKNRFWLLKWEAENKDKFEIERKYIRKYRDIIAPRVYEVLLREYATGDVLFEPIYNKLSESDIEDVYSQIDKSDFLSNQEKFETMVALMYLLSGSIPESASILSRFEKIFGKEFVQTIKEKRDKLHDTILV